MDCRQKPRTLARADSQAPAIESRVELSRLITNSAIQLSVFNPGNQAGGGAGAADIWPVGDGDDAVINGALGMGD
jgi:hypothetical protein